MNKNSICPLSWQAQDFKDPEPHHRHVSHLFGLFPGHTITSEKTSALCKAAENTLHKRGMFGILFSFFFFFVKFELEF